MAAPGATTTTAATSMAFFGAAVALLMLFAGAVSAYPMSLDEGEPCVPSTGGAGVCRVLSACPAALEAYRRRREPRPVRCGFVGWQEVVCCSLPRRPARRWPLPPFPGFRPRSTTSTTTSTTSTTTTTTTQKPERPRRPSTGKAKEACERYRHSEEQRIGWFILGGEEVAEGEFPHVAALGYRRQGQTAITWRCGGTLVSERFVLTAAHCLTDKYAGLPKVVRLGEVDLRPAAGAVSDYAVDRAVLHPRYKRKFNYDDVAVLRLAASVAFTQSVAPACLPDPALRLDAFPLIATGWGATDALGVSPSPLLLKTNLTTVPLDECRRLHGVSGRIPQGIVEDMICAGDPRGIADTCVGDSGGPLQVQEDPRSSVYTVVGITSFGPDPCGGRKPGVYVKVSSYVSWIESVVWE